MRLAEKISRLRGGRSNTELAEVAECSAANIQKIVREGSQPNFALGVRLAWALGVPAEWLADDAADWPPPVDDGQRAAELVQKALTAGGLIGELDRDEIDLLALVRSLDAEGRAGVRGFIRGLSAGSAAIPAAEAVARAKAAVEKVREERQRTGREAGRPGRHRAG